MFRAALPTLSSGFLLEVLEVSFASAILGSQWFECFHLPSQNAIHQLSTHPQIAVLPIPAGINLPFLQHSSIGNQPTNMIQKIDPW